MEHPPSPFTRGMRNQQHKYIRHHKSDIKTMENKNIWGKILNIIITVLTAIATTFGVTSCIGV